METKIEKIDKNKINEEIIEEAGMILKNGGAYASFGGGDRKTAEVPKNHIYKRYGFCPGADGGGDVKA